MRLLAIPLLLAAAAGCVTTPESPSDQLSSQIFEDIPAPRDSVYRDRDAQSFSFRSSAYRCARFVYDSWAPHESVVAFYRDTMTQPPYSWTLAEDFSEKEGAARLVFTKGEDRCTVDVDRLLQKTSQGSGVVIRVRVNYTR
jgi:hypothetical protein